MRAVRATLAPLRKLRSRVQADQEPPGEEILVADSCAVSRIPRTALGPAPRLAMQQSSTAGPFSCPFPECHFIHASIFNRNDPGIVLLGQYLELSELRAATSKNIFE
jgi:hypothetical protein